jgi:D-glycero-alpha-D-manno-heptose-7-phosphate kinase
MRQLVDEAQAILTSDAPIAELGKLLHESWQLKRALASGIATAGIDALYETACQAGAIGGKILGAGGGGFFLLFCAPELQPRVLDHLGPILRVPFSFTPVGTEIIYYNSADQQEYAATPRDWER